MAKPRTRRGDASKAPKPDGQLRLSQMVTTFGPGAMVDLVNRAVVIGGLEHWQWLDNKYESLDDARLRAALLPRLKALSPDLDLFKEDYFRRPPACDPKDPTLKAGIRALEFPRWLVCQGCHRLATPGHTFEAHKDGYVHKDCRVKKVPPPKAIPVRFVSACARGHLSDFPWRIFAHNQRPEGVCASPELYLNEGATGDLAKILVSCRGCGWKPQSMSAANAPLYRCEGESPWLGGRAVRDSACDEQSSLLVRTASNAYFAQVVSALRLPAREPSEASKRIRAPETWKLVQKVRTIEQLKMLIELQEAVAGALKGLPLADVVAAILAEHEERDEESARPLRTVEFEKIVSSPDERPGDQPEEGAEFAAYRIPRKRIDLPKGVAGLVILPELQEVKVQVSFSRLDSVSANLQGEYDFASARYKPAPLTLPSGNQKWLPAAQVRGEGIFVELDETLVAAWERRPLVVERQLALKRAFDRDPRGEFPGIRYYMLHCTHPADCIRDVASARPRPVQARALSASGRSARERARS